MQRGVLSNSAVRAVDWSSRLATNSWLKRFVNAGATVRPVVASEVRPDRLAWVCVGVGVALYAGLALVIVAFSTLR